MALSMARVRRDLASLIMPSAIATQIAPPMIASISAKL
jgi:hypothetical protein